MVVRKKAVIIVFLCLSLFYCLPAFSESNILSNRLDELRNNRYVILENLVEPVAVCVNRRDTRHTIFNGCIDWHSSVHGTWALVKYTGLTGNSKYRQFLDEKLNQKDIDKEFRYIQANPDFEMPYGRAWFLRLAMDYRAIFQSDKLKPMADFIARSLLSHYKHFPPDPYSREYENASWTLINMYDYGISTGNKELTGFVKNSVNEHFKDVPGYCPVQKDESSWPDFLSVCSTWAYLVFRVSPPENSKEWLDSFFDKNRKIRPIDDPVNSHQKGMNFSRSWGFWTIYQSTGDEKFLKLYLDHFELEYRNTAWWKGDYRSVGHWVPQFGIFSLSPLFNGK